MSISWQSLALWQPSSVEEATEWLIQALILCRNDPIKFNDLFLAGPKFWSGSPEFAGQVEWCQALVDYRAVAIETGNALGKDFWIGRIIPWWLYTRPNSLCIVTGPGQTVLGSVTWKEVRRAIGGFDEFAPPIPLGARISSGIKTSPHTVDLGGGWQALGFSTTSVERASGQHAGELLVVIEEASGAEDVVWEAVESLKYTKLVAIGNPLRPDGGFAELCDQGDSDIRASVPAREAVRHLNTPSTASPHAELDKSPVGLADRVFLDAVARKYGKDSLWYRCHIKAERPRLSHERLIQPEWLDRAIATDTERATQTLRRDGKGGRRRISCDVGEGVGNARSVVGVRDDLGFLEIVASEFRGPVDTSAAIAELAHRYQVTEADVSYDGAGTTGKRLGNALSGKGLPNARPYFGSGSGGKRFSNLRSASASAFARRLDPEHYVVAHRQQFEPFHLPNGPNLPAILEELKELRGQLKGDKYALESKDDLMDRLGRSPDFADMITQSFREEAVKG
jgi:hypothetical protein